MAEKKKKETKPKQEPEKVITAFPEAAVVRVMRRSLEKEKMIKKEVKIAMNKWLEHMATYVSREMNKFPYVMMTKSEFNRGIRVFETLKEFEQEKQRILAHLDAIKKDIERLERDLGKVEEDVLELS